MKSQAQHKVLVVGSGGREHAICWKLSQSSQVKEIFCLPGNGGTAITSRVHNVEIAAMDFAGIAEFAQSNAVDLIVIGPDNPIAEGIVDFLSARGLRVFGPTKAAAMLESSKSFAKQFMVEHGLPTARFKVCRSYDQGQALVDENDWLRIVKVDGLALGKGVFVCDDKEQVLDALKQIFKEKRFGDNQQVVLEERLNGEEISLLLFCDGKSFAPMPACQDHKRRFDGDTGPNTGGMGAYTPVALYQKCKNDIQQQVLAKLEKALQDGSLNYQGVLYIGLMVETRKSGNKESYKPFVLEFNARLGDPETQAILPLMQSDLCKVFLACTEGTLKESEVTFSSQASCCVVAAADVYPERSSCGEPLELKPMPDEKTIVFQAGTRVKDGLLVTNGGRILSVTATAPNLQLAIDKAYAGLKKVDYRGISYRKDIARRAADQCLSH